jgi:hypothetical protein
VPSPSSRFADLFPDARCAQLDVVYEDRQVVEVALRVLMAITAKQEPERADVETLRKLELREATLPIDELACAVVTRYRKNSGSSVVPARA